MADKRIFRVTKQGRYGGTKVQYSTRTAVSAMFGAAYRDSKRKDILSVEYTNAEATEGWNDCTEEFRNPPRPGLVCRYHKTYTGKRKPDRAFLLAYVGVGCDCWEIYCKEHPDYPSHWEPCHATVLDPKDCPCQVSKKLFG